MSGDLRGSEPVLNRSCRDAKQHCSQTSFSALLKTDNYSEFAGKMLDKWIYERGIRIDFSRPGTPTDNATVESFNGRLRQECLNENGFMSLDDARYKIEARRIHYNQSRPHSAFG